MLATLQNGTEAAVVRLHRSVPIPDSGCVGAQPLRRLPPQPPPTPGGPVAGTFIVRSPPAPFHTIGCVTHARIVRAARGCVYRRPQPMVPTDALGCHARFAVSPRGGVATVPCGPARAWPPAYGVADRAGGLDRGGTGVLSVVGVCRPGREPADNRLGAPASILGWHGMDLGRTDPAGSLAHPEQPPLSPATELEARVSMSSPVSASSSPPECSSGLLGWRPEWRQRDSSGPLCCSSASPLACSRIWQSPRSAGRHTTSLLTALGNSTHPSSRVA